MSTAANEPKYSPLAIAIHWIVALCVVALIPAGIILARLDEGPLQERMAFVHQSVGMLVLALTIVRLAMRAMGRMPPPASVLTSFERVASRAAHFSLYVLLLITPIVGVLGLNAYGDEATFFGLFRMPAILAKDEELSDQIFAVHLACGLLIALVVLAHIVGAVVHKLRKDGVNERMLPGAR